MRRIRFEEWSDICGFDMIWEEKVLISEKLGNADGFYESVFYFSVL